MKRLAGIFVLCALIIKGRSLKCFKCMDSDGDCTRDGSVCDALKDQSCTTTLIAHTVGEKRARTLVRSCGVCGDPTSFNAGFMRQVVNSSCCASHLCNNWDTHVTEDMTPNGFKCYSCFNSSAETCIQNTRVLQCVGNEYYCFHDDSTVISTDSMVVAKGCASQRICWMPRSSRYGVQTTSDTSCCKGPLCNHHSNLPGLKCHSQLEGLQPIIIRCILHACKTLQVSISDGGRSQKLEIRGCGSCKEGLSFSTGTFSLYISETCCQTKLCNNQSIPEAANTTLNGLECYGCAESGNNSCEAAMAVVQCVGEQQVCLYASGTTATGQPLTLRGCATPNACRSPERLRTFAFNPGRHLHCCQGNRCNSYNLPASSTEQPITVGNNRTDRPMKVLTTGLNNREQPLESNSWKPIEAQTVGLDLAHGVQPGTASPDSEDNLAARGGSCRVWASLSLLPFVLVCWLL
ncbi:urokinase plasminogen activator surface receptor-like [Hemitrygon akajei]|uniref:urokinase plasminogen activator surface receptor-like n=1 Tax=Hemitrygon akajei TaxID=2704970 RepID=UPI003BF9FC21